MNIGGVMILALVTVAVVVPGLLLGRLASARYLVRAMSAATLVFAAIGGGIVLVGFLLYSSTSTCGSLTCPIIFFVVGGYGLQLLGLLVGLFACAIALTYVIRHGKQSDLALVALGSCLPLALLEGYVFLVFGFPSTANALVFWLFGQEWGIAVGATWAALAVLQPLALLAISWRDAAPRASPARA